MVELLDEMNPCAKINKKKGFVFEEINSENV